MANLSSEMREAWPRKPYEYFWSIVVVVRKSQG